MHHQRHLHQLCLCTNCVSLLRTPAHSLLAQIDGNELKSAIRNSGAISSMYQESLTTFGYLVAATVAFDLGVFAFKGPEAAFDFLTAYFVEDSLSVDNLFVFLLWTRDCLCRLSLPRGARLRLPCPRRDPTAVFFE